MERLSVAVKCHDCNNPTRDLSGYCQHHRRNSKIANQVAFASGALTHVRLAEVQRMKQMEPERIKEISTLGSYLVAVRPHVLVDTTHNAATIRNVFSTDDQAENFKWGDDSQTVEPGSEMKTDKLTFYRAGSDMLVYPNADLPHPERASMMDSVQQEAFKSAEYVRSARAETYGLEAKSESYDDKAEVLAQLRLGGNDAGAVRYSTPSDGKLIVFVKSPSDPEVIERWTLERQMGLYPNENNVQEYSGRYMVSGEGELISRRTREKVADHIGGNARHDRAELIASIGDAIETIEKHAVTKGGKLHLPLGWTD